MKNGICTQCGGSDIQKVSRTNGHRTNLQVSTFSAVKLDEYVCCGCGLVETYLADMTDVDKIRS